MATKSAKRYWDDLATRRESNSTGGSTGRRLLPGDERKFTLGPLENTGSHPAGAPLLDYWKLDDFTPTFGGVIMGHARFIVADVFDGLAQLEDESVDLIITSPPFLALRSYLAADHPDKDKEIGSEATPAEFIDVLLEVTKELRRVLAPHGSLCVELGDTYSGTGGAGGDWSDSPKTTFARISGGGDGGPPRRSIDDNWPLSKSKTLIPQLYEIALAYGFNPLTGQESPAGKWRIRNIVTWARPNPPVGALGDKWRPATSDVVVAATSEKRYWDDLATRKAPTSKPQRFFSHGYGKGGEASKDNPNRPPLMEPGVRVHESGGAPLLDYWEIPPTGYSGAHYAVYPPALVEPLIKAMCPQKVCRECGEPSRPVLSEAIYERTDSDIESWTDCGHDNYRPGIVLDPFAGTGTTLMVATGHGHDAIGIDIDERNAELALERVGPFLLDIEA